MGPRILPSELEPSQRRIYRRVLVFFALLFSAMIWPIVALFSHAEPLIFGMPFFLFYLAILLLASFGVLLALFLWEERHGLDEDPEETL
jgi:hypothetical protein